MAMRAVVLAVCVGLVPSTSALREGSLARLRNALLHTASNPQERNAQLKQKIEWSKNKTKELEGMAQGLIDQVTPIIDARNSATKQHREEQQKLAEEVLAVSKEATALTLKCNKEYREAHEALRKEVMKVHLKATGPIGLSTQLRAGSKRDDPADDGGDDKMKYIEENKLLEDELSQAKSDMTMANLRVQKYEAALAKAKVGNKHWDMMLDGSKKTYEAKKTALQEGMKITQRKCDEAKDIMAGVDAKAKELETAGEDIEDKRYQFLYDWRFLENSKTDELVGRDDGGMAIKEMQGRKESLNETELKCAKDSRCNFFCNNPDDVSVYYTRRDQGFRTVGNHGAGWKCFAKKTKDTWSWHYLNNQPTQELIGRDDHRSIMRLKGEKDSFDVAKAKCASEPRCQYFCNNPDDWSSYYETRQQGYRNVGHYGRGWKCYSKHWEGDPKPEPLRAAKLHKRTWHRHYWDGRCSLWPCGWYGGHCSQGGHLVGGRGCGFWNAGCEGLCMSTHHHYYWVNR